MGDHKEKKAEIRTCHIVIMGIKYGLQRGKVRILPPCCPCRTICIMGGLHVYTCLTKMTQDFKIYLNAGRSELIIGPQACVK